VAYVFLRPPTGWVNALESQKLTGTPYSIYGHAVTLSDDASILAVGAPWENPLGGAANFIGTTHVLARRTNPGSPDSYAPVAKLVSSDGIPTDFFGASISASGDGSTIVVGAPVNVYEEPPHAGAAYVFVRPKRGWGVPTFSVAEAARLTTTDSWENDRFGQAVDISVDGRTIVVTGRDRPLLPGTIPGPGAGYFFAKRATGWAASTENTKVPTPEGLTAEGFGMSTALSGDGRVSIFGAPFETIDANVAQGAAYVFTGSANDPIASVSPGNLTFASQPVGSTSSPRTVTMNNTGAGPLHIASVGVIGPFVTTQNCVSASPLAPGASCSEAVAFAPASMDQAAIGRLTFTDDSRGTPETTQYVQLQGTARKANTTTTISLSASRVRVNQPVTVSFSVAAEPGSTLQPFGTVTVLATTGESCTSGVVSGSCTVAFSTVGNRTVTATYNGNVNFNPSTSSGTTVRVVN
jgi:hypothetical protein